MGVEFLIGVFTIILIDIVLSGDNAVVIALACRNLPAEQQKKAVFFGSFGAIALRVLLTFIAVWLLKIPFVQILGGVLLLYIAVKLLKNDEGEEHLKTGSSMSEAIKTIMMADLVMSLDNVLAVAGAANGSLLLIIFGLAVSIPLMIWGSKVLMKLMNRFPIIVVLGAGLLGYTAGDMIISSKTVSHWLDASFPAGHYIVPLLFAVAVIVTGKLLENKRGHDVLPE